MTGSPHEAIKAYSEYSKSISEEVDLTPLPRAFEGTEDARLLRLRSLRGGVAWCFEYGTPAARFSVEFFRFPAD